ncbi:YybH family protein [Chitinimonas sp. BJB300]|uniref:YybH family protein n=1 Tax=Chitinimonas sp. BJB300 TaxID=1559339 RepID=UPI000C0D3540|nr:DUF4440 domain-containing protein [Chitinimonas sp. BJB300]PHV11403.1 DUF4440 domain-containing protein [Chitinimonas sp. BJB300]TSJ91001.1 nuclear transport factor 2 family protein [Chitinimonas sp. BJB300]
MKRIHLQGVGSTIWFRIAKPRRTTRSLLLLLAMVLAGGTYASEAPATVEDVHRLFAQYLATGNKVGIGSLFEPDAVFIAADGTTIKGRDNVINALSTYMGISAPIKTLSRSIHINGELAMTRSHWKLGEQEGVALETLRYDKRAGWRYVIDNPHGR